VNTPKISKGWYFLLSYLAYSAYSVDFIVRAYLQPQLMSLYHVDPKYLGPYNFVNTIGLLLGVIIFGCLIDKLNFKTCFIGVWLLQILGLIKLTILSPQMSLQTLSHNCSVSMLFMGLGEGGIFALIHSLVTIAFHHPERSKMNIISYLHTNWPVMIIIACIGEWYLGENPLLLKTHIYLMFVFPCLYLILALIIPLPHHASDHPIRLSSKIRFTLRPGFVILFCCMMFTSTIEHSPRTWFISIADNQLHVPLISYVLYFYGIQLALRLSSSLITPWISPPGLLSIAAIISCISLYILGQDISLTTNLIGLGLFSASNAWYWPSFITMAADRYPLSGSFGMALMNAAGYLSFISFVPIITQLATKESVNMACYTLSWYSILAFILLSAVYTFFRSQGGYKVMTSSEASI
jgi:MFS family permease